MGKLATLLDNMIKKINSSVKTEVQSLSSIEKEQARSNINADGHDWYKLIGGTYVANVSNADGTKIDWATADTVASANGQKSYIDNETFSALGELIFVTDQLITNYYSNLKTFLPIFYDWIPNNLNLLVDNGVLSSPKITYMYTFEGLDPHTEGLYTRQIIEIDATNLEALKISVLASPVRRYSYVVFNCNTKEIVEDRIISSPFFYQTDNTLTRKYWAADGKAVGEAIANSVADSIKYTEQDLTDSQKIQSRTNISAYGYDWHDIYYEVDGWGKIGMKVANIPGQVENDWEAISSLTEDSSGYAVPRLFTAMANLRAIFDTQYVNNDSCIELFKNAIVPHLDELISQGALNTTSYMRVNLDLSPQDTVLSSETLQISVQDDNTTYFFSVSDSLMRPYGAIQYDKTKESITYNTIRARHETVDNTLSQTKVPADAAAVGQKLKAIEDSKYVSKYYVTLSEDYTSVDKSFDEIVAAIQDPTKQVVCTDANSVAAVEYMFVYYSLESEEASQDGEIYFVANFVDYPQNLVIHQDGTLDFIDYDIANMQNDVTYLKNELESLTKDELSTLTTMLDVEENVNE